MFVRGNLIFLHVNGCFMCHCVNLSWKVAVQNAGFVFAYFCDGQKNNYNFVARLISYLQ